MIPLAVHVEDLEARTSVPYAFIKSPVRVGRGELNDLTLDAPFVSTWHGVVQFDDDGVRFVDLGSTNGTWLDGERLEKNVPAAILPDSDLRIGTLRLRLVRGALEERPAERRPSTQYALRAADASLVGPAAAEAAPPPPASGPDRAAEAVEAASWQLGVLHESVRQARENFETALAQALLPLEEEDRARARALVVRRFADAAPAGGGPAPLASADPLRAFAASYVPEAILDAPGATDAFLRGLAEVLETSVKSYLELRRGYDEFGREMGVRVPRAEGGLARLREAGPLLGYLLAPSEAGEPRARELAGAFADLMIHQVALLNGVTEGAKDLLARLSPEAVSAELDRDGGGKLLGMKPLREGAQWRAYVERWRALADEESALSDVLFGKAFARAYAAVAGRRGPAPGESDDTPPPAGPDRRDR